MSKSIAASLIVICFLIVSSSQAVPAAGQVESIFQATGVKGGVIVHVRCGDGALTAALRAGDGFLVHGLDTNAANVAAARVHIRECGLYGQVSVDMFDGRTLPYVDNFVNLVVADDLGPVPMTEVMRVLVPKGVAFIAGKKTVKPWPKEMGSRASIQLPSKYTLTARDAFNGTILWQRGIPDWFNHLYPLKSGPAYMPRRLVRRYRYACDGETA